MKSLIISLLFVTGIFSVVACGPTDPEPETSGPVEICDNMCLKYCSNSCGGDYPCIKNCKTQCDCE
jgi:hypothetical protein